MGVAASAKLKTICKNSEKVLKEPYSVLKLKSRCGGFLVFLALPFFATYTKPKKGNSKDPPRWVSGNKNNPTLERGSKENLKAKFLKKRIIRVNLMKRKSTNDER